MSQTATERRLSAHHRLIDAASDVIAEQGWQGASVLHIGERAALSRGAVNYHFGSKELLLEHVLASVVSKWQVQVRAGTELPDLAALLDRYWAAIVSDPRGARLTTMLLYESLGPSPSITGQAQVARRQLVESVEWQLGRLQSAGRLTAETDCHRAATFVVSALSGLVVESDREPLNERGFAELRAVLVQRLAN